MEQLTLQYRIFALSFGTITLGSDLHLSTTTAYDVPSISMRNVFLAQTLAYPYAEIAARKAGLERYGWEERKEGKMVEEEMKRLRREEREGGVEMWMSPEGEGFDTRHVRLL